MDFICPAYGNKKQRQLKLKIVAGMICGYTLQYSVRAGDGTTHKWAEEKEKKAQQGSEVPDRS